MNLITPDGVDLSSLELAACKDVSLVVLRVADYTELLSASEKAYTNKVVQRRKEQFSSGRFATRLALNSLNVPDTTGVLGTDTPQWPSSLAGSIAHSDSLAVAVVCYNKDYRTVGVDILPKRSVSDKVRDRILLESERQLALENAEEDWQTKLFAAKEGIYKASNPETDEFLGFKDVRVHVGESGTQFTAKTTSAKLSSDLVARGRGYFFEVEDHWLTLFLVP